MVGRCGADVGDFSEKWDYATRDAVIVTATNNRGPIIYRAEALRELGFFDEVNFVLGNDDHDMNRRAFFFWYAAYKYSRFYAPLGLSPGRNCSFVATVPEKAQAGEREYLLFRQSVLPNRTCDPRAPSGFASNNPRTAIRCPLKSVAADEDPNESLPTLSPLFLSHNTLD